MSDNWPVFFCPACNANASHDSLGCRSCRHRAAERSDAISDRNQRIALFVMLGLALGVPTALYIGHRMTDGVDDGDDDAPAPVAAPTRPAAPVRAPAPATIAPPVIEGRTPKAKAVAEAVIAWCGYNGNAALWRGDFTAEGIDIGKGEFNVTIDHKNKADRLNGHTLWYLAKTKRGKLYSVTPNKQISADVCRGLSRPALENGVEAIVDHDDPRRAP